MTANIIGRESGEEGRVILSLRLRSSQLNNAIALDITTDKENWEQINSSLKYYMKAYRRGADFEVDGRLKSKLWNILRAMDSLNKAGKLTLESARAAVKEILRTDAVKEAEKLVEEHKDEPSKPMTVAEWIEEFIRQCETGERLKQGSVSEIKKGTVKGWKTVLHNLQAFEKDKHRVLGFDDITIDFLDEWRTYLARKQYSPNTVARHIKALKRFMRAAKDMKLTTCMDFESSYFTYTWVDVDNVYLTEDKLQELYELDVTDQEQLKNCMSQFEGKELEDLKEETERENSREAIQRSKDVFVVGCLTGQRFSDYSRITKAMITKLRDGNEYIKLRQVKTGKTVYIPLDQRVVTLLDKYGGAVPKTYDTKMNRHIKIAGHLLGWTDEAGLTEHKGVMEYQSKKKFYECIKTHTARRTFATNMYKRGISLSSIMSVTGHSSELMLRKYLKLDNKERAILAAAEFARLKVAN